NPLEDMPSAELLALIARDYVAVREEELAKLHRLARKIEAVHRDSPVLPKGITLLVKALQKMLAEQVPRVGLNTEALPAEAMRELRIHAFTALLDSARGNSGINLWV